MKLSITCERCRKEDHANVESLSRVEFNDSGRYEVQCSRGHTFTTFLQQQKFEILFEIGAYAINDGYYREAVSSFTSSLERFYEFFIKVICVSKNIELTDFQETWKDVSNQSERQLGAFMFLYLLENGSKPALLHKKKIEFRNAVIHKGKIPNKEEALEYGQAILDLIRPMIKKLREDYDEDMLITIGHYLFGIRKDDDPFFGITTLSIPTIINLIIDEPYHNERTLSEAILQLAYKR